MKAVVDAIALTAFYCLVFGVFFIECVQNRWLKTIGKMLFALGIAAVAIFAVVDFPHWLVSD